MVMRQEQALLILGRLAGLELWGTARGEHAALIRELGATRHVEAERLRCPHFSTNWNPLVAPPEGRPKANPFSPAYRLGTISLADHVNFGGAAAALIIGLFYEHRRRRVAEVESRHRYRA
jgi:hypothetical protein